MTSLHKRAFVITGLHLLFSLAILLFALGTAWASAASGAKNELLEVVFYTLQPLWFLMTRHDSNGSFVPLLASIPLCSLLYGYTISSLFHLRSGNRDDDCA